MSMRGIKTFLIFASIPAFAAWSPYNVKRGDTLGSLAKRSFPSRPVWGKEGSAAQLFEKNKDRIRDFNVIYAGQEIFVPENESAIILGEAKVIAKFGNRKPATDRSEFVAAEVEKSPAPIETNPPAANTSLPGPNNEDRLATLKVGFFSSLWDRSLRDKTTGASGTARSDAILGISLESLFPVSETWDLTVGISYRNIKFSNASNRTVVADSQKFVRYKFGAARSTENFEIGGGFLYEQLPLITGVSSNSVGVTGFNVFSPYLTGKWQLHRYGKTSIGLGGFFAYNLASSNDSYKLQNGWMTEISLPLIRAVSNSFSYGLAPFFEYGPRNTNTVEHTDTNGGVKADLIWRY